MFGELQRMKEITSMAEVISRIYWEAFYTSNIKAAKIVDDEISRYKIDESLFEHKIEHSLYKLLKQVSHIVYHSYGLQCGSNMAFRYSNRFEMEGFGFYHLIEAPEEIYFYRVKDLILFDDEFFDKCRLDCENQEVKLNRIRLLKFMDWVVNGNSLDGDEKYMGINFSLLNPKNGPAIKKLSSLSTRITKLLEINKV